MRTVFFGTPEIAVSALRALAETTNVDPLLWHVDPDSWLKIACTIAGRNLTHAEWQDYLPHRAYERTCAQYPRP